MRTRRRRSDYLVDVAPLSEWPALPLDVIAEDKRDGYLNNKMAVELWVAGKAGPEIRKRTGRD